MRWIVSLLIGLAVGIVVGLYLGWERFPVEYIDSPMSSLSQEHKDAYTLMIAAGYVVDRDALGAVQRLRLLDPNNQQFNVPIYVQEVTERFITNSRSLQEIRYLVALAEGLGRLTPVMEPYRQLSPGAGT